jgi:hypothetical protein
MTTTREEAYAWGYNVGEIRREDSTYDVRYDMADAAKERCLKDFKRGMTDALDGNERTP